jgi:hypothetical protein
MRAMARHTFEEGDRPLHRVRYAERPEGIFPAEEEYLPEGPSAVIGGGEKCVSSPAHGSLEGMVADTAENGLPTSTVEMRFNALGDGQESVSPRLADGGEIKALVPYAGTRRCEWCDGHFLPARQWSRFCSPACRLRAHRGRRQAENQPAISEARP